MPPPMVRCSICNRDVLKAQTFHVGGGKRACKIHDGVESAHRLAEREAKAKLEAQRAAEQEKAARKADAHASERLHTKPFCWLCHKEGITGGEMAEKLAIANEKMLLKNPKAPFPNPFDPAAQEQYAKRLREELGLKDGESLTLICVRPVSKDHFVMNKLSPGSRMAAELSGVVSLCLGCTKKNNLLPKPSEQPNLNAMMIIGGALRKWAAGRAKEELDKAAPEN